MTNREPIFIICTGRSGSTMLRYILDSHNKINAPQELHLGPMIREMRRVVHLIHENTVGENMDLNDFVNQVVNSHVNGIIRARSKYEVWCDKSVSSIDHLDEIMQVFPKARYIFLYRDCLDFVHSALEVSKYGFEGFYFEDFILKNPKNLIEGLVNFWCMQTEKRMELVSEPKYAIYQVKYEDIVQSPNETLKPLFDFLELDFNDDLLEGVFSKFRPGRGDIKVQSAGRILDMTGKGRDVPIKYIKEKTFERMNSILEKIGYPKIDSDYNFSGGGFSQSKSYDQKHEDKIFDYFTTRLENIDVPQELINVKLGIDISGTPGSLWKIDFQKKIATKDHKIDQDITLGFKLRMDTLLKIINKELNISWAFNQGMIKIDGSPQKLHETGKYLFD